MGKKEKVEGVSGTCVRTRDVSLRLTRPLPRPSPVEEPVVDKKAVKVLGDSRARAAQTALAGWLTGQHSQLTGH
jgi:hypothetical protein